MSVKKKWNLIKRTESDPIDQILINRGISLELKEDFLNPDFSKLHDPYLLKDMHQVVERLLVARDKDEKVGIFADYDADGITSGTLMQEILTKLGINSSVYIPSRDEGYGLNILGIDKFIQEEITLIIAVDMGITGRKEVEYCHRNDLETIIIDHHLVQQDKIPSGLIINPRQTADKYPFKDLSACGLVYKLAQAISVKCEDIISKAQLKWWLDLTAISTIADMVPLVDENRVLAYFGLIVLNKTKRVGLKALFKEAKIEQMDINPGTVGFKIAPRLNAPGRVEHAGGAYSLLVTGNINDAKNLANEIEQQNEYRREETERIFNEAKLKIIKNKLDQKKVIIVSNKNWSPGLVGIVAGRIMEEFARPTIVLDVQGKLMKGSARSIQGYHLLKAFEFNSHLLTTFGGHARAGGLSMNKDNLNDFYSGMIKYAQLCLKEEDLALQINIDYELTAIQTTLALAKRVATLEPYGFGNQKPVFIVRSLNVSEVRSVGKDNNHLKLRFNNLSAIFFNGSNGDRKIPLLGQVIDIVFNLSINTWNNNSKVDLNVIDWEPSSV